MPINTSLQHNLSVRETSSTTPNKYRLSLKNKKDRKLSQSFSSITSQQQQIFLQLQHYNTNTKLNEFSRLFIRPLSEMQKREQLSAKLLQTSTVSISSPQTNTFNESNTRIMNPYNSSNNYNNNNNANNSNTNRNRSSAVESFLAQNTFINGQNTLQTLVAINSRNKTQINDNTNNFMNQTNSMSRSLQDSNRFLEDIISTTNRRKSADTNYGSAHSLNHHHGHQQQQYLVINRSNEEKTLYPDKLILDRRKLAYCPILEGEDQLKLINFQHNFIQRIQNLDSLRNLIFLDFYDNQIDRISGLSSLVNLRVLMLGKNKISKIENLDELVYLDVLDLHGNEITKIENLNHLHELRVLNIAANRLKVVENLHGLHSLIEFNLRRNNITEIRDIGHCLKLQRLFLSFNEIHNFDSISNLTLIPDLQELALDGNPLSSEKSYKRVILSKIISLRQLDLKKISDDERRMAIAIHQKEEEKKRNLEINESIKEKRRLAIRTVQKQWSELRGFSKFPSNEITPFDSSRILTPITKRENDFESANQTSSDIFDINQSGLSKQSTHRPFSSQSEDVTRESFNEQLTPTNEISFFNDKLANQIRKQKTSLNMNRKILSAATDGTHLVELENESILNFYGNKSLEEIDNNTTQQQIASNISIITFRYIDFNKISKYIIKIRNKFINLTTLIFSCCNIQTLNQLNCLSELRRLDNIVINKDDNPIAQIPIWKYYALYKLNHLNIKQIDNKLVQPEDQLYAEKLFSPLAELTLELPEYRLVSVLGQHRKKQIKQAIDEQNQQARDSIVKSFLSNYPSYKPQTYENQNKQEFIRMFIDEIISNENNNELKKQRLKQTKNQIWNQFLTNCLQDTLNPNEYVDNLCKRFNIVL